MSNTSRFQYRLQDVLIITLLSGILPIVAVLFAKQPNSRLVIAASVMSILLSTVSGLIAVQSCNERHLNGFRRVSRIFRYVGYTLGTFIIFIGVCWMLSRFTFELEPSRHSIASNEAAAVVICKAFVDTEEMYFKNNTTKNGIHQYAPKLRDLFETSPGKKDVGLIAEYFADAEGEPGVAQKTYLGYCFKVLKAQGQHAKNGAKSYLADGIMSGGYALVAYPYEYDTTGHDTFIVSCDGTIYQKDLGEKTPDVVKAMTEFDPDSTWRPAQ